MCSVSKCMMIDYEINLRAVLEAFMVGTESSDIGKAFTTMDIGGEASFKKSFTALDVMFIKEFFADVVI